MWVSVQHAPKSQDRIKIKSNIDLVCLHPSVWQKNVDIVAMKEYLQGNVQLDRLDPGKNLIKKVLLWEYMGLGFD